MYLKKNNLYNIAIIPARGKSKGIPRKNIKFLGGKPLIAWTIDAALKSQSIKRVIVSTEDEEIADIAKKYGAEVPFLRPIELSEDDTPTLPVLQDLISKINIRNVDNIITLQPTSPFRTTEHLNEAINIFESNISADSLVSCIEVPHNFTPGSIMKLSDEGFLQNYYENSFETQNFRRQDKPIFYARNGAAIYITKINMLQKAIVCGNIIPYFMDRFSSIDIDNDDDFIFAEYLIKSNNAL